MRIFHFSGDSGGPARSVDGVYLAGIVSWGEGELEVGGQKAFKIILY